MAAKKSNSTGEPGAVDLVEEAVHLLRRHPGELAVYFAATGPFAIALLYFWAHVTWFSPPDGAVAWGALLLTVLFGAMKAGQHHFARRLLAHRMDLAPPPWSWPALPAALAAQLRLHAPAALLLPLAAVFGVPFGWAYAYFHNATVLSPDGNGGTAETRRLAWAQAQLWPAQNHRGLAILGALWLMVFFNVGVAFYFVPMLATQLLGLKTVFAITGWSYLNTTFLFLMAILTHLLVDPLVRAFYLLRVFYGRSRRTGADLQQVLAREARRPAAGALLMLALAGVLALAPVPARAAAPPLGSAAPLAAPAVELDRSLDRVLAGPDYRWRLRPPPAPPNAKPEGMIQGFIRSSLATIMEVIRSVFRALRWIYRWVADLFPGRKPETSDTEADGGRRTDWIAVMQMTAYVLLAGVVVLLAVVALKLWRLHRTTPPPFRGAAPAPAEPDLTDENVQASSLPTDGWLDLARRQMAAGEWRLALRALFLATLARLAHDRLITLAKFKTNLDYERELHRRAPSRGGLVAQFGRRRREFEDAWYGATPAVADQVNTWLRELEAAP